MVGLHLYNPIIWKRFWLTLDLVITNLLFLITLVYYWAKNKEY